MHVTRVDLCKQLYDLSGWGNASWWHECCTDGAYHTTISLRDERYTQNVYIPAYDLSYLLRRLPKVWVMGPIPGAMWMITYNPGLPQREIIIQDESLEDAVCRLAIALFQRGILERNGREEIGNSTYA